MGRYWFRRGEPASGASVRVDMWPDVSELASDERCPTPLTLPDGRAAEVFSAYNLGTVDRHFRWLQEYDLPGVFLQRFSHRLDNRSVLEFRDGVARNVRTAAESHGRVFAIMYDISGHPGDTVVRRLKDDWAYAVDTLRITESPRYLRHDGRPVLAIWGFGFRDRSPTPEQAAELIDFFKNNPEPRYRVTLLGGVPARWRSLTRDSRPDASWATVYRSFDVLSPWTVGRFGNDQQTDRFYEEEVQPDLRESRRLRIDYMPVVFPGFSWHNMNADAPFNRIPRRGGRFYWRQIERAVGLGATQHAGSKFTSPQVTNMAIAVVYRPPAMTASQYKESWAGGPPLSPPPGLISHAGIGEGADFFTVTVWDSKEAYDAFAPMFAKAMSEMGFQFGSPQILPVHHFLPPGGY